LCRAPSDDFQRLQTARRRGRCKPNACAALHAYSTYGTLYESCRHRSMSGNPWLSIKRPPPKSLTIDGAGDAAVKGIDDPRQKAKLVTAKQ